MRTPHTVFLNRRPTMTRALIVSLIGVALVSIGLGPGGAAARSIRNETASVVQTTVLMLTGEFQVVNEGFGDQFDPHTNCDRVAYVNDNYLGAESIHYFDFATNTEHVIPDNDTNSLPDLYGDVIAFTESNVSGPVIVLFDVATQTRTLVDVMASNLAHLLSVTVTNPTGSAWYDRYGFENAAKCYGTFGQTYPAANGGPANIRFGQRDFMLQQNWVNARKGYCAMAAPQQ